MTQQLTLDEKFEQMKEVLYAAVICDTLDELGYRNQAMREDINPISTDWVLVGRAKTVLAVDVYHESENPYAKEIEAIDSVKPGEVLIGCTNESKRNGLWGELLSTASKMRGANGAVVDGLIRDTKKILELDFPVFATGTKPVDSRGRGMVIDYDCPVVCGGVSVMPGDIIFGDRDGVVVIPSALFDQVFELSMNKATRENSSRQELLDGKYLRDVYDKYGVL
ncbi:RraA family protein [Paenibacillus spongiae]|uniref:Putative 4-hydroxy-4-methyl-2-oxoglutarate aldolase n=1 Tax=Paenibacillus spongiae TaxID=2909671 RepID=A0ABY5S7T7_9BACL|nr:RraA family protein [Paenibacillus spongiae]UVI29996.1 RraA family protein [Paenibacillus spongiae]